LSILKKIIPIALSLSMIACGGGETSKSPSSNNPDDGNSSTPSTPELTLQLSESSVTVDENNKTSVSFSTSYSGSAQLTYTVNYESTDSVNLSVSEQALSIDAKEVEQDDTLQAEVTVTDGTISSSQSISISINNIPDLTFNLDTALIELEENSNAIFQLNPVEPSNVGVEYTISYSTEINEASISVENNELLIDVNELENDKSTTVTITASLPDKNITFEQSVELTLFNSSFGQLKAWSDVDAIFEFNDFKALPAFYAKAAYLHKAISYSEHKTYIDEYDALLSSVINQKGDFSSHSFIDAIASYEQNTMTESEVEDAFNLFKTQLLAQYDPLIEQLNAVASQLEGKVPLLSVGKLDYISEYEAFSGIVGDTLLGGFSESTWVFTPENSVLESLIPMLGVSDCNASSTGE
jgi:hypothetical protein